MSTPDDPDEGLWGQFLLITLGLGFVCLGLLVAALLTFDEDAGRYDGLDGLIIAGIGVVAIVAAVIGRAFGRWALTVIGLLLFAQAVEIWLEVTTDRHAPDRFTVVMLAALALSGVTAVGTSLWQTIAHHKRIRRFTGSSAEPHPPPALDAN